MIDGTVDDSTRPLIKLRTDGGTVIDQTTPTRSLWMYMDTIDGQNMVDWTGLINSVRIDWATSDDWTRPANKE